jgi:hypothetical protein
LFNSNRYKSSVLIAVAIKQPLLMSFIAVLLYNRY